MFVKGTVGVLVGSLLFLQNVNAQSCICKCGPTGLFGEEDLIVREPRGPLVVRPKALPKPAISLPLFGNVVKGPCFRRQAIVKPAIVPRPVYVHGGHVSTNTCSNNQANLAEAVAAAAQVLASSSSCSSNTITQGFQNSGATLTGHQGIDVEKAYEAHCNNVRPSAPADAVSLAIAYKLSQNNYNKRVAEDRLAYGFRKLPVELPKPKQKICKNTLPEANLYSLNGQIVELKPATEQASCDSLSEEAAEELLDLAISEEAGDVHAARRPSLSELGYAPAKLSSGTFIDIPSVSTQSTASAVSEATKVCEDGFKSGSVVYKDFANFEPVARPKSGHFSLIDDTSCESMEEPVKHIPVPAPTCQCNYNGNVGGLVYSHSSHHSSSSSTAHKKNSVVLQKLCS